MTPEEELALKALAAMEWSVHKDEYFGLWCPGCNEAQDDGHHLDCTLKAALDALRAKKAQALVRTGLEQARAGEFSESPPDLEADAKLAAGSSTVAVNPVPVDTDIAITRDELKQILRAWSE